MNDQREYTSESVQHAVWQAILALPARRAAPALDPTLPLIDGGLELDSVALLELIAALEEQFEFQFHESDLRTSSFRTVGSLSAVVAARLGVGR
jgi:acyl carrier protein